MVALEAVARDAERGGERVQLLEVAVDGHVAPVLDGEAQVVVAAQWDRRARAWVRGPILPVGS